MKINSDAILDERLSDLPRDVGSSKDLWPEVSCRIARSRAYPACPVCDGGGLAIGVPGQWPDLERHAGTTQSFAVDGAQSGAQSR